MLVFVLEGNRCRVLGRSPRQVLGQPQGRSSPFVKRCTPPLHQLGFALSRQAGTRAAIERGHCVSGRQRGLHGVQTQELCATDDEDLHSGIVAEPDSLATPHLQSAHQSFKHHHEE